MDTTPNLLLKKPETDDAALVGDLNDNADVLDALWTPITPSTADITQSGAIGSNTSVARSDHAHEGPGFAAPVATGGANSEGDADTVARSNHVHRAPTSFYNHVENVILDPTLAETVEFYVPAALTWAKLTLRGRTPRAGVLASHQHGGALTSTSTAHGHTGSTGTDSADHAHSGTTSGHSADHSHSGTSAGASADHTHSFSTGAESANHYHSTSAAGGHTHLVKVDNNDGNTIDSFVGDVFQNGNLIVGVGDHSHGNTGSTSGNHTHSGTSAGASAGHTHTLSTGGVSVDHSHTVTTGGRSATHNHALTVDFSGGHTHATTITAEGAGGTQTFSRPQGVTVAINGVDRTAALAGPFGSAVDWDVEDKDILSYVVAEDWNTISVASTAVGRLKVHVTGVFS